MAERGLVPAALTRELVALRHDLHRHPELAFQETRTAAALVDWLATRVPGTIERVAGTGVITRIPGRGKGATVAVRGDIDALPIREETGAPFASVHDGVMHACGHDVHAAWAAGAAVLLARDPAPGDVVLVLQPAEETGRGAPAMLDTKVLDGVAAIFGAHVDLRLTLGQVVADTGPLAGSTDLFTIEVAGRGGHAARPHETVDPIVAASAIVQALQTIVSRTLTPGDAGVVTVGMIQGGTAPNVIPDRAVLQGTLRATTPATRARLQRALEHIATTTAAAYGATAAVDITPGTPPIINSTQAVAWARAAVTDLLGADALVPLPEPNLGGEDFAFYLERMDGCFLRIGARAPDAPVVPAHTARFLPDDGAVAIGAAVLAETARRASAALA